MSVLEYDAAALKSRGVMEQKQPGLFTVRLRIVGGRLEADKLGELAEIVARHTSGHVHLTIRQGVEIPNVCLDDVESLCSDLSAAGLGPAPVGPCVRTITACQGGTCRHGIIDAQRLAERIHRRFSTRSGLPHKFKIGITGCPNACIKPRENDLGIMGIARKSFDRELCGACGLCVLDCPAAGALKMEDHGLTHSKDACVDCGKCIGACPSGAWESAGVGYAVFAGGKMGKNPKLGERLSLEITDEDQLLDVVGAAIEWYAAHGEPKERFGGTLDRIGAQTLTEYVLIALRDSGELSRNASNTG